MTEEQGGFGPIVEKMETRLKVKPKFEGSFLVIAKHETSLVKWEGNDVLENTATRTMYRKMWDLKSLGELSAMLKKKARADRNEGITTKFSIITCFAQDKSGQVIAVEKYGAYGLQEWKVGPGEKSD